MNVITAVSIGEDKAFLVVTITENKSRTVDFI